MSRLEKKYDFRAVEKGKYQNWIDKGYFQAGDKSKKPFTIVIPPPNVTGRLHLGHAWDNTLQDILIRYKKLNGYDTLFLPGMDHAGIATQAKIEEKLRSQGISRYDLGREKFLEKSWEWKDEYAGYIREQWEKLGNSLDYSRERFTLDEGLNKAVTKVFVDLYHDGLIFQGYRIINWDPQAQTALSNIEVIHKEIEGKLYTFKYRVVDSDEVLLVATTRPETMFADVAVVVHPDDKRYQHLIGKTVINPANGAVLPIISDDYIDVEFGTGAMKCTPAHDPNDFNIGQKYGLEMPICINPDGSMNELAGKYQGLDRFACRKAMLKDIEANGDLEAVEKHIHQVGHSERTDVIVEPYLSKQWFVKMKPLAQDVLQHQELDAIRFYPDRFSKTFNRWLENIEDWCISRQLWWGHRIPAWFNNETDEVYVGLEAPHDIENWHQDEDVLDTWFSSALWPFSTLGWPEETDDFKRYYPSDTMVTGYDIIFFWVARMAFQARYFTHDVPFRDVLIHGLIRDSEGRKMSKSLGNGVDPMDIIDQYGVDALRYFLSTSSTPGQDTRYIEEKVEAAWNFINKIWNASRFVDMHIEGHDYDFDEADLGPADIYILAKFNETLAEISANMEKYEFALVASALTRFVWDDFCSWYLELSKAGLQSEDKKLVYASKATLRYVLKQILIMLHPFMPFVTEEIYSALLKDKASIMLESWPSAVSIDESRGYEITFIIDVISRVRELRVAHDVKPSKLLHIALSDAQARPYHLSASSIKMLESMAKVSLGDKAETMIPTAVHQGNLYFFEDEMHDRKALLEKLEKDKAHLEAEIKRSEGILANPKFLAKAPQEKVSEEKAKLEEYKRQLKLVLENLES